MLFPIISLLEANLFAHEYTRTARFNRADVAYRPELQRAQRAPDPLPVACLRERNHVGATLGIGRRLRKRINFVRGVVYLPASPSIQPAFRFNIRPTSTSGLNVVSSTTNQVTRDVNQARVRHQTFRQRSLWLFAPYLMIISVMIWRIDAESFHPKILAPTFAVPLIE